MKVIRHSLCIRALLVALTLVSWLVLTNHCALAGLPATARTSDGAPSCCHRDTAPAPGGDACPESLQCCKTAKAALTQKVGVAGDRSLVPMFALPAPSCLSHVARAAAFGVPFDHGPPRARSFAELVLQHCLPSHAPPVAA